MSFRSSSELSHGQVRARFRKVYVGLTDLPETASITRMFRQITRGSVELQGVFAIRVRVIEVHEGGKANVRVGPQAVTRQKEPRTMEKRPA